MHLLFVCNQGRHRSRTAAELLAKEHETRYGGLYDNPFTREDLAWADIVFVMEDHQREGIAERFPKEYLRSRIITLGIPDVYSYGQPGLAAVLRKRISGSLQSIRAAS